MTDNVQLDRLSAQYSSQIFEWSVFLGAAENSQDQALTLS